MQSLYKNCEKLDFITCFSSTLFNRNDYYHVSNKLKCLFIRSFQPKTNKKTLKNINLQNYSPIPVHFNNRGLEALLLKRLEVCITAL